MSDVSLKVLKEEIDSLRSRATDLKDEIEYVNQTLKDKEAEYEYAKGKADGLRYYKTLTLNGYVSRWLAEDPARGAGEYTSYEVDPDTDEIVRVININKNYCPVLEEKIRICKASSEGVCKETAARLHRWREELRTLSTLLEDFQAL